MIQINNKIVVISDTVGKVTNTKSIKFDKESEIIDFLMEQKKQAVAEIDKLKNMIEKFQANVDNIESLIKI